MRLALWLALTVGFLPHSAWAKGSPWLKVTHPEQAVARERYAQADSKRTPADPYKQGPDQELLLNEMCARSLLLSGVEALANAELQYLLADCLTRAPGQYVSQARDAWLQALRLAPEHPQAARAWLNVGLGSEVLDDLPEAVAGYTQALTREWDSELRAGLYRARAQVLMRQGLLVQAMSDYRVALAESHVLETRTLAQWGLAVALDRAYDHPSALALALSASRARFGNVGRTSLLDLEQTWITPDADRHYYRALGLMAEAKAQGQRGDRTGLLQSAQLMWLQYLDAAPADGPWVARAREHLAWLRLQLGDEQEAEEPIPEWP